MLANRLLSVLAGVFVFVAAKYPEAAPIFYGLATVAGLTVVASE